MKAIEADNEIRELLANMLDGKLDEPGRRRLNERLHDDADARQLYLDMCDAHAALAWEHGLVVAEIAPGENIEAPSPFRFPRALTAFGAMAAALVIGVVWWMNAGANRVAPDGPVVASITSRIDAVVTAGATEWNSDEVRVGEYELARGLIQMEYVSGVSVLIEAPAQFEVKSAQRLVLLSGRVSANVPPEGVGFTVETPEAEVVDFGTEFSVEAGAGESEVHVFDGHVRVQPKGGDATEKNTVDLRTSQAVRIGEGTGQPAGIDLATDRFIRSIDEPQFTYPQLVNQLKPIAHYRMPIRAQGLACVPKQYAGRILTGEGKRPACAPGRIGAALRVGGRSLGRGGLVENGPVLSEEEFSIAVWIYARSRPAGATIVTDGKDGGRFSLQLDEQSAVLKASLAKTDGSTMNVVDSTPIALETWHHVVMSFDGETLRLFRDGQAVSSTPCDAISSENGTALWIGTGPDGVDLWSGRIDELALFNFALTDEQVQMLFDSASDETPQGKER